MSFQKMSLLNWGVKQLPENTFNINTMTLESAGRINAIKGSWSSPAVGTSQSTITTP
jgi:hypothetical protein